MVLFPSQINTVNCCYCSKTKVSTCSWAVGLADIGKDFTELKCDVSVEGSDLSCVSKTNRERHLWTVCVNVEDAHRQNLSYVQSTKKIYECCISCL